MLALTVGHVAGGSGWGFGWGSGWGFAFQTGPIIDDGVKVASNSSKQNADRAETPSVDPSGDYPGVILWPEIKPVTMLVAPPMQVGFGFGSAPRPLTIAFGGEYWMFRWPYSRPPKNSFFKRGAPTAMFFSTTDNRPLQMEAHHKLEGPLSMSCCRSVEVAILKSQARCPRHCSSHSQPRRASSNSMRSRWSFIALGIPGTKARVSRSIDLF